MARRAVQDEGLAALIADRVNLEIRVNLLENRPLDPREARDQRSAAIASNRAELAEVERRIAERRKGR
jgi:hypothetical protein